MTAPAVSAPTELPDLRAWLLDQWVPGHLLHSAQHRVMVGSDVLAHIEWEKRHLREATLWWVSPDMVDVLNAAARSIPEDVHYSDLVPPSPSGLVVFASPIEGHDAMSTENIVHTDAIVWGVDYLHGTWGSQWRRRQCISVSSYRHLHADALKEEDASVAAVFEVGDDLAAGHHVWLPLGRSDWPLDEPLGTPPDEKGVVDAESFLEDRRLLAALWTLLMQKAICTTAVRTVDRATLRRSERVGIPRALSQVRTVYLRQPEHAERALEGGEHHYSHRWVVQPHFVWQPYGPGRSLRKLIVRGPYIKGPKGTPLHTPEVVRAWVR